MAALDGAFPGAVPAAEFLPAPPALPPGGPRSGRDLAGAAPDGVYLLGGRDPGAAESLGATAGLTPRKRDPRAPLDCRQKHKMEEEADSCPASKKRRTAVLSPPVRDWTSLRVAQPMGRGIAQQQQQQQGISCATGALEIPCEEMEQVMCEQQCEEAARRKFQEIEDRIIDEEEDDDDELVQGSASSLPTLVLSDTLKTGLKRDYEGILTKKIVESMSRPSMELVLWKPLPEFLTEKSKPVPIKSYKPVAEGCRVKPAALHAAFHPPPEDLAEPQPAEMPSDLCGAEGPPGGAEEEMEL